MSGHARVQSAVCNRTVLAGNVMDLYLCNARVKARSRPLGKWLGGGAVNQMARGASWLTAQQGGGAAPL